MVVSVIYVPGFLLKFPRLCDCWILEICCSVLRAGSLTLKCWIRVLWVNCAFSSDLRGEFFPIFHLMVFSRALGYWSLLSQDTCFCFSVCLYIFLLCVPDSCCNFLFFSKDSNIIFKPTQRDLILTWLPPYWLSYNGNILRLGLQFIL